MSFRASSWLTLLPVVLLAACATTTQPEVRTRVITIVPTEEVAPNQEIARAEQTVAAAQSIGADDTHPLLVARAYDHIDKARAAWDYAVEEAEVEYDTEPDDADTIDDYEWEYILAIWWAQKALADAEVALANAQATNAETKVVELQRSIESLRTELKRMVDTEAGAEE